MPRTGLPEVFADAGAYDRLVTILTRAGAIDDASYLWWSLRPSIKFPTLELRIADACTRLEDSLCLAALFRCLVRLCVRRPDLNAGLDGVSRAIAGENLWRAQRDGIRAELIDEARGGAVSFAEALDGVLALIAEDAQALGCEAEVARAGPSSRRARAPTGRSAPTRRPFPPATTLRRPSPRRWTGSRLRRCLDLPPGTERSQLGFPLEAPRGTHP